MCNLKKVQAEQPEQESGESQATNKQNVFIHFC